MRAYLPVTASELQLFLEEGTFSPWKILTLDVSDMEGGSLSPDDLEEREYELSWQASQESRTREPLGSSIGIALAVDIADTEKEDAIISWSQVQSALVSDSAEPELSWFAVQEIPIYLPQWML